VVARVRASAPAGVRVEDKAVSLTIHVRSVPERLPWAREFAARESEVTGLAVHDAKMSVELRPPVSTDKGAVVARLLAGAAVEAACFVGDDLGDLSAFRALDGVPTALRVAVSSAETPPELVDAADIVVDGPGGVLELLRALAA
jgi:trehalose 6-phosphate phosphatase